MEAAAPVAARQHGPAFAGQLIERDAGLRRGAGGHLPVWLRAGFISAIQLYLGAAAVLAAGQRAGPRSCRCRRDSRCGRGNDSGGPTSARTLDSHARSLSLAVSSHSAFLMAGCTKMRSTAL